MPIVCSSRATVYASRRHPKPSPLDQAQRVMERSHPPSGRSATPADINRNGRPTSIGTGGRHQSECPAGIIGIRTLEDKRSRFLPPLECWLRHMLVCPRRRKQLALLTIIFQSRRRTSLDKNTTEET